MVKPSRVWEKVQGGSKNIRFRDFQVLLEGFGYELKRVQGSHHTFAHPDVLEVFTVQPAKDGTIKLYLLNDLKRFVRDYNLVLED